MARVGAQAVGLYYPTPTHLFPLIADLVRVGPGESYSVLDPCAADGDAVISITQAIFGELQKNVELYACEMEATRFDALRKRQYHLGRVRIHPLEGDAMRVTWERADSYGHQQAGASLAFINPPYDADREYKRLEERFLRRFAGCLAERGVLIWLVPYYSLVASADTLAREFSRLRCYRFPDGDFEVFKQVVLVGEKTQPLRDPDPTVRAQVLQWSASTDGMPVLGSERHVVELPGHPAYKSGFHKWSIAPLDVTGMLARLRPWSTTDRAGRFQEIPGVTPDPTVGRYPLAVPPKPAHLAAAIASGVFNGAEVLPEKPGRPRLRVKGVFDKEFVTTEEKKDKEGAKVGEVQVQQPKLLVTVLDTHASTYHTLKSSPVATGDPSPAAMSTGDLLTHYGRSLMGVMREQCPVQHDPTNDTDRFPLPSFARKPYRAQEEAIRAVVKLLGGYKAKPQQRRRKAAFLLGEIGSGKSLCFLAVAATIQAKRVLVTCPPHLIQSWIDQARLTVPWASAVALEDVEDVDAFCTDPSSEMRIAVMSRSAKLTHRWDGVTSLTKSIRCCPKCGGNIPVDKDGIAMTADELASKRRRHGLKRTPEGQWMPDGTQFLRPVSGLARAARDVAQALMLAAPHEARVNQIIRGRARDRMMIAAHRKGDEYKQAAWLQARPRLPRIANRVARIMLGLTHEGAKNAGSALMGLLAAINDPTFSARLVERLYTATMFDIENYGTGATVREWCRSALLLLPRWSAPLAEQLKALNLHTTQSYAGGLSSSVWGAWAMRREAVASGKDDPESYHSGLTAGAWNKHPLGSVGCAIDALGKLHELGTWREEQPCGEFLYGAVPEPRKVSLSAYLAKKYPGVVDLLGIDEAHELANTDSAQSASEHRLTALGMPTVVLTGSVMNGYAKSLFANQWALDPHFREEFPRGAESQFTKRYGYIKQLVQEKDKDGKVVEWGSQSDRKQTATKEIGQAPGVLPLFLLRYLLRLAVTLHKTDLALDLPKHQESVSFVYADAEMTSRYTTLLETLKRQIKQDRFDPVRANMLFGMLSELPSYLDRATEDCGNREDGSFAVAYPINEDLDGDSGRVLASFPGLPASSVLPKERWTLDYVERALSKGRRVMIFAWHEAVLPRISKLVERELGEPCALLQAQKVQAGKRQAWIDAHVIAKKRRVLAVNGAAVQTGLNNLVWFQDAIWHQNPGVNPIVYRQAVGRIDRIGKTAETEAAFPVYADTAQELAHRLLMHKVGVSMAADGLDAESALQAAGVGSSETIDAFSVGRALFELMEREPKLERPIKAANDAAPAVAPANENARKAVQLNLFG